MSLPSSHSTLRVLDTVSNAAYVLAGIWVVSQAPGWPGWLFCLLMFNLAAGSTAYHAGLIDSTWDVLAMYAVMGFLLGLTATHGQTEAWQSAAGLTVAAFAAGLGFLLRPTKLRMEWYMASLIGAILLLALALSLPTNVNIWLALGVGAVALLERVFAPSITHWHWHLLGALAVAFYAVGVLA